MASGSWREEKCGKGSGQHQRGNGKMLPCCGQIGPSQWQGTEGVMGEGWILMGLL